MKTREELREYHRKYNAARLKAKKAGVKWVCQPTDGRRTYGSKPLCECLNEATVPYGKKFICERCHKIQQVHAKDKNYCGVYLIENDVEHQKFGESYEIHNWRVGSKKYMLEDSP